MPRLYLSVPPEENAAALSLGASWDADAKCWYIASRAGSEKFSRWLGDGAAEVYEVVSHEACVVTAHVSCAQCNADIEVLCIHCFGGTVAHERLQQFTLSDIREMDEALSRQLALWPYFRQVPDGGFANHCTRCGEPQEEMLLHSEPAQPFFDVPAAIAAGRVTCTPLLGTIRLSGDQHPLSRS